MSKIKDFYLEHNQKLFDEMIFSLKQNLEVLKTLSESLDILNQQNVKFLNDMKKDFNKLIK